MTDLIDKRYFEELAEEKPQEVCKRALCDYDKSNKTYLLTVWGDNFVINPLEKSINNITNNNNSHEYLDLFIIYYLLKSKDIEIYNEWISEKDIPGGTTFFRGPHEIPTDLISTKFNENINNFHLICEQLDGLQLKKADAAYYFKIAPRIPVIVLFWDGDEDFPAEAKIMYDKSISEHLTPDIVFTLAVEICNRIGKSILMPS